MLHCPCGLIRQVPIASLAGEFIFLVVLVVDWKVDIDHREIASEPSLKADVKYCRC